MEEVPQLGGGWGLDLPGLESQQVHEIFQFSSIFKRVLGSILPYFQWISAFFLQIKAAED